MSAAVVQTRSLTKRYGTTVGVEDLDLELSAGEIFGFIGPNGAGKTTTIRLLLDLIHPTAGSAAVFGLDVSRSSVEIRQRVGYLPGRLTLYDRMTAAQLFAWLGRFRSGFDAALAAELAERLSLNCSRRIGELSTGNRQKVGIVQAFMHRPELLILDEPTSGLDPVIRREFRSVLVEAKAEGATVMLSSHVLAEVEEVCDRVGTIVGGRLRDIVTVDDLSLVGRRRFRVVIEGSDSFDRLAALPGVSGLRCQAADGRPGLNVIEFDALCPLDAVIKELAGATVVDVISRETSLEETFLASYDGNSTGRQGAGS